MDTAHAGQEHLRDGMLLEAGVTGKCMEPLIGDGWTVLAEKPCPHVLFIGDVVIFRRRGEFLVHRILFKYRKNGGITFVTKGDSRKRFDYPLPEDRIEGRVVIVRSPAGEIDITSPAGRLFSWTAGVYSGLSVPAELLFNAVRACMMFPFRLLVAFLHSLPDSASPGKAGSPARKRTAAACAGALYSGASFIADRICLYDFRKIMPVIAGKFAGIICRRR